MKVLAIAEHNNHELLPATLHTVNAAKQIGDTDLLVVVIVAKRLLIMQAKLMVSIKFFIAMMKCIKTQ